MKAKELREAFSKHSNEELIGLLVKIYRGDAQAQHEIESFLSEESVDDKLLAINDAIETLSQRTAGEVKLLLSDYIRVEKDRDKRIELIYSFIEATIVAYEKNECDHRMVMLASSYYGRTVKMMNKGLWDSFFERTYAIADKFYAIPMEAGIQAVRYYQEVKRRMDSE